MLEWGELMNVWLREGNFAKASSIQKYIQSMIKTRAAILNPKSSADVRKAAKREMRSCMSKCTIDLGLSFTVKGQEEESCLSVSLFWFTSEQMLLACIRTS